MRAPGSPQTVFAVESALDELAASARMEPAELRRRNLLGTGEANAYGQVAVESRAVDVLEAALRGYSPMPVPEGWRAGTGLAVYDRRTNTGGTSIRLTSDARGRLNVEVPFPEQGGGSHTVVREGLARALDLDAGLISVSQVATDLLPHDDGVGGSRVTAALSQLIGLAATEWAASDGGPVVVQIERGEGPVYRSYCAQLAQVAVDPQTGWLRVLQVLTAVDVAEIVNPAAHRMQLDGAAAMGFGFACLEDLEIADGQVGAASLAEFRLPTSADVPAWRTVLVEGSRGIGALNVKAVSELANVPTAAAIANAVAAATGVRIRDLPVTAEKIWSGLSVETAG